MRTQQYHDLTEQLPYVLGSFSPKALQILQGNDPAALDLSFGTCDFLAMRFERAKILHIDVFDYHLTERTLFGEGVLGPGTSTHRAATIIATLHNIMI